MDSQVLKVGFICVLAAFAFPVNAENESGVQVGISMVRMTDTTGPFTLTFGTNPPGIVNRGQVDKNVSGPALEISYPIIDNWHINFILSPNASSTQRERWPLQLVPPPQPPVQASTAFNVKTEIRSALLSAAYTLNLTRDLEARAHLGALYTRKRVSFFPPVPPGGSLQERYTDTETRPWFGVAVRYRVYRDLSLIAEYGGASGGFRSTRIGLGWTF